MSQKPPVDSFKWKKKAPKFNKKFKRNYEDSDQIYIFEVDVKYPLKDFIIFIEIYHSCQKE